jgi:hypothetical protein
MKRILVFLTAFVLLGSACRMGRRIKGNGHLATEERHVNRAERIKVSGSYDVELTEGPMTSVKVEADENLLPYVLVSEENGTLQIRSKNHVNFSSDHNITIYITTSKLEEVSLSGSGNITGKNKFTASERLSLSLSGSGDMEFDVNAAELKADISGSGGMILRGETRRERVSISGVGEYTADELKAEEATVRIAGSGDVKIFADVLLDVNVAGSGSVFYKGNATVKQRVVGSGEIKRIE